MIAVLGAGAWGTTVAKIIADAGHPVTVWARREAIADEINSEHTNRKYLKVPLPETLTASADLDAVMAAADVLFIAVPSQEVRGVLEGKASLLQPDVTVVSLVKGIELGTGLRVSEIIAETLNVPTHRIAVLSGPNLSVEIAAEQPAASVLACTDLDRAKIVGKLVAASYFRPYVTDDVIGVELAGAIKNVIAIAVGMAAGCGYGDNTKASIITRGLAEITRLAVALGGDRETMAGLAGMGDLVATCASQLSRNHRFGRMLGEGLSVEEALEKTAGTAEGAKSSRSVAYLAQVTGVEMPITRAVMAVLYGGLTVDDMTRTLLSRPHKDERD